jgi:hypothetical protein
MLHTYVYLISYSSEGTKTVAIGDTCMYSGMNDIHYNVNI